VCGVVYDVYGELVEWARDVTLIASTNARGLPVFDGLKAFAPGT
jgi:hypothetical protein